LGQCRGTPGRQCPGPSPAEGALTAPTRRGGGIGDLRSSRLQTRGWTHPTDAVRPSSRPPPAQCIPRRAHRCLLPSCLNTGLSKGQAERARAAKGGELLEVARGRRPDGEARVSFAADGRVTLYALYRTIRTTERRGSDSSDNSNASGPSTRNTTIVSKGTTEGAPWACRAKTSVGSGARLARSVESSW